ncbi:hypothetical protein D9Q98_009809 [Chlorella vulgaris]|uniref:Plastid division regulator MinE n=2 Tax=Chlorella vulgaris TaxID=3077 RepID=A0A9D4TF44_CHLVU|nr:hypothetical protein D9Q98_009809 [Chlorella vulgaris]
MHPHAAATSLQPQRPAAQLKAAGPWRRTTPRCRSQPTGVRAYQGPPQSQRVGGKPGSGTDQDVSDIVLYAKHRLRSRQADPEAGKVTDFFHKLQLAWRIFFPEQPREMSPKEEGKQRLRMILVADRVGMNEITMEAMRERIIGAVSPYVEIESPDLVEVAVTTDVDLGAIYSVAVPVRRVKAAARVPLNTDGDITFNWDPTDEESDPSSQFPYGT